MAKTLRQAFEDALEEESFEMYEEDPYGAASLARTILTDIHNTTKGSIKVINKELRKSSPDVVVLSDAIRLSGYITELADELKKWEEDLDWFNALKSFRMDAANNFEQNISEALEEIEND